MCTFGYGSKFGYHRPFEWTAGFNAAIVKPPLPEKDFLQMRKLAVKLLSKQLDVVVEDWEDKQNIKPNDYEKLGKGHFRSKI